MALYLVEYATLMRSGGSNYYTKLLELTSGSESEALAKLRQEMLPVHKNQDKYIDDLFIVKIKKP
ncbi:MAG: hypothetical protein J1F16_01185 [Muribaculaceae bacterium]|nr:hypothetical protein [Muribaculaceae bacterium]